MSPASSRPRSVDVRSQVVEAAVGLFSEHGFEATSVDDLARAAGLSRSTYFRQVGGKEDAVFADHPHLIDELAAWLQEQAAADPWATVCAASERVFAHLTEDLDLARRRYAVVRAVRALSDREIITERRYEQLFSSHLRQTIPGLDAVDATGFAALVTATHNHFLRQAVRTGAGEPAAEVTALVADALHRALATARSRFGVGGPAGPGPDAGPVAGGAAARGAAEDGSAEADSAAVADHQVVVASFPTTMPSGEVLRRVREALRQQGGGADG